MRRSLAGSLAVSLLLALLIAVPASAMSAEIWYPVQVTDGLVHHDNYGDCRSGCSRTHRGNDIMSPQMTEVYAAESGYIRRAYGGDSRECFDAACSSYGLLVYGDDGNSYFYLHFNNDTPGRPNGCDGRGGPINAFGPRLTQVLKERGSLEPLPNPYSPSSVVRVEEGELIGYTGSSGNAGCRTDHIHFEMWAGHKFYGADDSRKSDPYPFLQAARDAGRFWGPDGAQSSAGIAANEPAKPAPDPRSRVAGSNRVQTSVRLSQAAFPSADAVVIAPAEVYPEALIAAPLGTTMNAPVLLTWNQQAEGRDLLDPAVAAEIDRLGASYAVIVGSPDRIGPELEAQLVRDTELSPGSIRRIAGTDRYDLARRVAEQIAAYHGGGGTASGTDSLPFDRTAAAAGDGATISPILALGEHEVEGRGWPDALAASALAAGEVVPVLLTEGGSLPAATKTFLQRDGIGEVRIVGGTAAVSQAVEDEVRGLGLAVRRLAGSNRFQTSLAIAEEAVKSGASRSRVWVATGANYPDALASGQAIATLGEVLVLVEGTDSAGASSVYGWLRDHAERVDRVYAIGGTGVVSDEVLEELAVHANWPN